MSFSVERNESLVDEFLDKSLTVLEFETESIRMTDSVKALLYREKYEGEFRIEDPEG